MVWYMVIIWYSIIETSELAFWSQGPRQGGFQKPSFAGSICFCGPFGPLQARGDVEGSQMFSHVLKAETHPSVMWSIRGGLFDVPLGL